MSPGTGQPLCRYYSSGCCSLGDSCKFSHVRGDAPDMVCRFYLRGSCNYGTACRYDHVKPKKEPVDQKPKFSKTLPKPAQLSKPGLNLGAQEFVPSWKRADEGTSYSAAAGAQVSESTERSTPLCPYFEMGQCNEPDCCFVHGDVCEYCNKAALHPFNEEQRDAHTQECIASHETAMEEAFAEARSADKQCGICMDNIREKSERFGILNGCKHCFCLTCIREWRRKQDFEATVVRSCPECRQHSDFVIPSLFWAEDEDEKKILIELYRENTGQKQCKYYLNKEASTGCPFGNKCFYKHQLPDGTIDPGESPHVRRKPQLSEFLFGENDSDSDDLDYDFSDDLLRSIYSELTRSRLL